MTDSHHVISFMTDSHHVILFCLFHVGSGIAQLGLANLWLNGWPKPVVLHWHPMTLLFAKQTSELPETQRTLTGCNVDEEIVHCLAKT